MASFTLSLTIANIFVYLFARNTVLKIKYLNAFKYYFVLTGYFPTFVFNSTDEKIISNLYSAYAGEGLHCFSARKKFDIFVVKVAHSLLFLLFLVRLEKWL